MHPRVSQSLVDTRGGEGVMLEGLQLVEGLLPTCSMMKMSCLKWVMCKHDGLTNNSVVDTLLNCEIVYLESQCFTWVVSVLKYIVETLRGWTK